MQRVLKEGGRYLKGAAFGKLGFCTSWAVSKSHGGWEWVEVVETDLHLKNLPEAFVGKRIVHISDLHCSNTVSSKYLRRCIKRVNSLEPDIVVLTGDYITHDYRGRFREKVTGIIGKIESKFGIYACLGNHDYGIGGWFKWRREHMACEIAERMVHGGVNVLRNDSDVLEIDNDKLWFVGLGDLWVDDFEPEKAYAGVTSDGAVITLAHNPAAVKHLDKFDGDAVMCGHTHGSWFDIISPFGGSSVSRNYYCAGMYKVGRKKLYVNRGLGRLGRAFFNTRPEITVFNLC